MKGFVFTFLFFYSTSLFSMQSNSDWLITPRKFCLEEFEKFYVRIWNYPISKSNLDEIKPYLETHRANEPIDEWKFWHIFLYWESAQLVPLVYAGIKKNEFRQETCIWQGWLDSPLHGAISRNDHWLATALLSQNADTSLLNVNKKTPLQVIKRMALRDPKFSALENCLKRYIWHKHVLLRKRFREKWGVPFADVPADVVGLIAHSAFGSYK